MASIKMTKMVNDYSINTSGETLTQDFPSTHMVTCLEIVQQGANVTDEATLAELLAGFGDIKISTDGGQPWNVDADDLWYFNEFMRGQPGSFSKSVGAGADNDIRYISLWVPLNPRVFKHGMFDPMFGITPGQHPKLEITLGSNTAAGSDARTLDVNAYGLQDVAPLSYMGMFKDSYTAVVGDNFRDIQASNVAGMFGAFIFGTTGYEDLTSTDAPSVLEMGFGVSKSLHQTARAAGLQQLWNHNTVIVGDTAGTTAPNSDYWMLNFGLPDGTPTIPYVDKLQAYVNAGVAEAQRLYPLLDVRNVA